MNFFNSPFLLYCCLEGGVCWCCLPICSWLFEAVHPPIVGMSSILEIVILLVLGSSSLTKDSSVSGSRSPNTFLLVVHLLVFSWIINLASSSFVLCLSEKVIWIIINYWYTVGIWGIELQKEVLNTSFMPTWEDHKNIKKIKIPRWLLKLLTRQESQSGPLGSVFWP